MEPGRSYHMCIDIDAPAKKWAPWTTFNGRHPTIAEFEAYRAECKAKGYTAFPPCDNVKPDGRCAGHEANALGTATVKEYIGTRIAEGAARGARR